MWDCIEKILMSFKSQFSRAAAFKWFTAVILGFMVRTDKLGITSVLRALLIAPKWYESNVQFFRADSWSLASVQACWYEVVSCHMQLFKHMDKALLVGDGTKQSKEGQYMPGVKKLAQESETQSKPDYIHGHMWGGVGVLIGKVREFSCAPLSLKIHDGLQSVSGRNGTNPVSHVV